MLYSGTKLLDYGCGDGTLLAEVRDLFPDAVGADIDPGQTQDCRARFSGISNISFVLTDELASPGNESAYGVVTCMEVMEHCIHEDLERVITDLRRLVSPEGVVIISVPIEIGPALIGKQVIRSLAGWRGLGDYKYGERYTSYEFLRMVFAGEDTSIPRPAYSNENGGGFYLHKGFNWRNLRMRLQEQFEVKHTLFSPFGWLGGYFSSQAWFICRPRVNHRSLQSVPKGERHAVEV
jgi:SAM-dependent methyltransferase